MMNLQQIFGTVSAVKLFIELNYFDTLKKNLYFCPVFKHKYLNILESRFIYSNITLSFVFLKMYQN